MWRRLAVVLFLLGLLRVFASEGTASAQYPWSATRTPTRTPRPTLVPTRPVVPTIAATTPTPAPSSPPATATPIGMRGVTLQLSTFVTGAESVGFDPVKYEVEVLGRWYTLVPRVGCWTSDGVCIALGASPYLRITGRDGSVRQGPVRLSPPRILLAQAVGPVNLIQFTTPQIQ